MRIGFLSLLLMAAVLVSPVRAQSPSPPVSRAPGATPARDPIADLLNRGAPGDEDEPDTAGQPRTGPEADLPPLPPGPAPKAYTAAPQSDAERPVGIDDLGKTPDAPPTSRDQAYDARIRASFASAQSFQGPLDGGWTLSDRYGDRYVLQIVDRRDRLEAVWRDLRRAGSLNGSGLVDSIQRTGSDLTLRFTETQTPDLVVTLRSEPDGRWSGKLMRGDDAFPVTLRRTGP